MVDRWEIEVKSNYHRPAKLVEILETCGARVRSDGTTIFLTHPHVPAGVSHKEALDRARKLIGSFNFLVRRLHGVPTDLVFQDVTGYAADGGKYLFALIQDTVVASCEVEIEVRKANGELVPPPSLPTDRWRDLLLNDPNVSLVSELLDRKPAEWNDLYRVLEIIAGDVGGLHRIHELGWATNESLRRFKHTANSPASIGLEARHGVDQGQPPTAPMIRSEALALIELIVYQWIGSKT